jgi:hypothetical protein
MNPKPFKVNLAKSSFSFIAIFIKGTNCLKKAANRINQIVAGDITIILSKLEEKFYPVLNNPTQYLYKNRAGFDSF